MTKRPFKRRRIRNSNSDVKISTASHDDVEFRAVDLLKLSVAPQKQHVLRLLSVLNDLDSGTYLGTLLSSHEKSLPNLVREKWHDGVVLYLLRQRIAIIYSALYDILREMKDSVEGARPIKRGPKTPRLLWHMIIDDKELDKQLTELVVFLEPGKSDSLKHVRDKLAAHADDSAFSSGLKKLIETSETGMVVRTHSPQRFRAFFVDDIVSKNWEDKAIGPANSADGVNTSVDEMKRYSTHIAEVRSKTADFVYLLFNTYCEEFKLLATEEQSESLRKELQDDLMKRRKKR
ncbi:hypothetical protein KF728_15260 [Candidatus Obscuribacterales bacterium]|nr:hypothetical protein [Candidatus Obscuribacterales bacterium]